MLSRAKRGTTLCFKKRSRTDICAAIERDVPLLLMELSSRRRRVEHDDVRMIGMPANRKDRFAILLFGKRPEAENRKEFPPVVPEEFSQETQKGFQATFHVVVHSMSPVEATHVYNTDMNACQSFARQVLISCARRPNIYKPFCGSLVFCPEYSDGQHNLPK